MELVANRRLLALFYPPNCMIADYLYTEK